MVERHHCLPGRANRKKCEKYGFIAPLRYDLHPNGVFFENTPENRKIDLHFDQRTYDYDALERALNERRY